MASFFEGLLQLDGTDTLLGLDETQKDSDLFPEDSAELRAAMRKETSSLVEKIVIDAAASTIRKLHPDVYVDLSSIAKGYASDQVAVALEANGLIVRTEWVHIFRRSIVSMSGSPSRNRWKPGSCSESRRPQRAAARKTTKAATV